MLDKKKKWQVNSEEMEKAELSKNKMKEKGNHKSRFGIEETRCNR